MFTIPPSIACSNRRYLWRLVKHWYHQPIKHTKQWCFPDLIGHISHTCTLKKNPYSILEKWGKCAKLIIMSWKRKNSHALTHVQWKGKKQSRHSLMCKDTITSKSKQSWWPYLYFAPYTITILLCLLTSLLNHCFIWLKF